MDQQCLCEENWNTLEEISETSTGTDHARCSLLSELAMPWHRMQVRVCMIRTHGWLDFLVLVNDLRMNLHSQQRPREELSIGA